MKKQCLMAASLCLFVFLAVPPAHAAKADGPKAKFFAKYDKNHNGKIDPDEMPAIRKDYAADPKGDLKRFDKNGDGKLDDEELAAIKPPAPKTKADSKGKKSEKAKEPTTGQEQKKSDEAAK